MNVLKYFFLLLFIISPVCLFSQQQHNSLLGLMINNTEGLDSDMAGNFMTEENGIVYDYSGKPCHGYQVDYYDKDKNKIRISGRFKKGVPVDVVKGYYENGVIKFKYYPFKKKYKYRGRKYNYCLYSEYDENGNCIRYIDDMKGVERRYGSDGSLHSVLYYRRKASEVVHYEEYYPGNKKKTVISGGNKYDYDENGCLRRHWVRKSERHNKKYGTMSATIYFEEYDVSGNISRIGRLYTNLYEHDQWLHISPEFPASINSVPTQDFKEITYPRLNMKDVYKWDYSNNRTIITRYALKGKVWVEIERKSLSRSN